MQKIDTNCLLGQWPFRKIRKNTYNDLLEVHIKNSINFGYVSSLNSIFYNDPFEGEKELHEILRNTSYKHILTVNPDLPGFEDDIKEGVNRFNIKGVKIYPGYHGYNLDSKNVKNLCNLLMDLKLPLFISMRMEDERLDYIIKQKPIALEELEIFIKNNLNNFIIMLSIRPGEVLTLKDTINSCNSVYFDTSGLKDILFVIEKLIDEIDYRKILYGSNHPLYCQRSTILLVEKANIKESIKEAIFYKNANILQNMKDRV